MATTTTAAKKTVAATKKTTTTPDTPRAPKHLSKATAEFFRSGLDAFELDEHHIILLVKALESFDLAEKCRVILDKEGLTYTDRFGSPRARPGGKVLQDAKNSMRQLFRELSLIWLTTTNRASLTLREGTSNDGSQSEEAKQK